MLAPTSDPQKIVSSLTQRHALQLQVIAEHRMSTHISHTVSAPAAIIVHPIANPSKPSVRFTALDEKEITSITK